MQRRGVLLKPRRHNRGDSYSEAPEWGVSTSRDDFDMRNMQKADSARITFHTKKPMKKKGSSNKSKGDYYFRKTKMYLLARGYIVEKLEISKPMFIRGKMMFIRTDLLYSDGIAINEERVVLFQVKMNMVGRKGSHTKEARENYEKLPSPNGLEKWIVEWEPRKQSPMIEVV